MTSNKNLDVSMDSLEGDEETGDVFTEADGLGDGHKATEEPVKSTNGESDPAGKEVVVDVNTNNHQHKPMPITKKHRRGSKRNKRRKYKPYPQLTWEEKKAVEERDSRRAVSIREKYMHEKGRPLAPFNTSQFLMAEHDTKEPDLHVSHHHHHDSPSRPNVRLSSSADDSDDGVLSSSDEDQEIEDVRNFLQKDFTETYDRLHSESLHRMNKNELVNEYMQLEDKVENLEKELTNIKSNGKVCNGLYPPDVPGVVRQVNNTNFDEGNSRRKLELEVETLREENRLLHIENGILRPKEKAKEEPAI